MKTVIRILAWGNRGRRDDGVALALAERLEVRLAGIPQVAVHQFHQLGPELVEELADCRIAVFVDARVPDARPPVVVEPLRPSRTAGLDTHHCDPGSLLSLAQALGYALPRAYLVSIHALDMDFGDSLSPTVVEALDEAEAAVLALVDQQLQPAAMGGH